MRKSLFLFTLLASSLVLFSCKPEQANVILIMADDMGAECLSMYGGNSYHTPNLDRMANQGLTVSHCIAQPLCTPSRVKLMTGLSNSKSYTHFGRLDTKWLNIGTVMKEAGYKTCISGKWQLNGLSYKEQFPDWNDPTRPIQMGFDEYCLWQLTHGRGEGERFSKPLIEQNGEILNTGPDHYGPDIFCNYILDFIHRNSKEPFFIYYPMVLVHEPFVPTPDSENWEDRDARYQNDTSYFAHMVSYTDKIVGRIQKKLEEEGVSKKTILIFTGDNGTHTSIVSHTKKRLVRGAKGNTISDGVHVPLLISWPEKIKKASVFQGLIEFSDFFATMADLVGREVDTDGQSFLALLEGKTYAERETVSVHYDPRWGKNVNRYRNNFVQNIDYKLYLDSSFYHLSDDIYEKKPMNRCEMQSIEMEVFNQLHKVLFAPQ